MDTGEPSMRAGLVETDPRRWLSPKPRYHGLGRKGESRSDLEETALARRQEDAERGGFLRQSDERRSWRTSWPARCVAIP